MRSLTLIATLIAGLTAACGGNDTCDPVAQTGCDNGQVCENVSDGTAACFGPVTVQGRVFDLATDAAIAGASVVALDVNGAPLGNVAITADDGTYSLPIPSDRAPDGTPVAQNVTLRADASGYQSFPGGIRQALPIDTGAAVAQNGGYVVQTALTDVGLIAEPSGTGTGSIAGHVDVPDDHAGVLVVAEDGSGKGFNGIADRDGAYTIFNLAAGDFTVKAYARGHVYDTAQVTVAAGAEAQADLHLTSDAPGTLTGQADIVAASGGSMTSIVMMVESTYDDVSGRGVTVPGLRAPDPGTAPNVTGAFTIDGVPPGRYVVLAAFENDALVRDPDPCISGTDIVHVEVMAGQTTAAPYSFKVTSAVTLTGPGADQPEAVTSAPMLSWTAYPSTQYYNVSVFDSFGTDVWDTQVTGTSVAYGGPLDAGQYYQVRVYAGKNNGNQTMCLLSSTEDLRGVFYVQ